MPEHDNNVGEQRRDAKEAAAAAKEAEKNQLKEMLGSGMARNAAEKADDHNKRNENAGNESNETRNAPDPTSTPRPENNTDRMDRGNQRNR